MKKLQFESNGSKWLLLCANNHDDYYLNTRVIDNPNGKVSNGVSLCMITEEQASKVVEKTHNGYNESCFKMYNGETLSGAYVPNAIQSLHSLLNSKGIHLYGNTYQSDWDDLCIWGHGDFSKDGKTSFDVYKEAEEKTFYNPVLFKILK